MGIWQNIKRTVNKWLGGGSNKKVTPPKVRTSRRDVYTRNRNASAQARSRGGVLVDIDDKKERERVSDAFKATKRSYQDMAQSVRKSSSVASASTKKTESSEKKTPPKPKTKTTVETPTLPKRTDLPADWTEMRKAEAEERKEAHKKTGNKYNIDSSSFNMGELLTTGNTNPEFRKLLIKYHPAYASFERGAASGGSWGATDLMMKKFYEDPDGVEQYYQENRVPAAEFAGEIVGSFASFGGTGKALEELTAKGVNKFAPNLASRLAESKLIQASARRGVDKLVKKGALKGVSAELIEAVGKKKAEKLVQTVGTDILQNATSGLIYDINRASSEYEIGTKEWWNEMKRSAEFNFLVTGALAGLNLRSGKRLIGEAADEVNRSGVVGNLVKNVVGDAGSSAKTVGDVVEDALIKKPEDILINQPKPAVKSAEEVVEDSLIRNADEVVEDSLIRNADDAVGDSLIRNADDAVEDSLIRNADEVAEAETKATAPKTKAETKATPPTARAVADDVDQFAGVTDDASQVGFDATNEQIANAEAAIKAEAANANTGKTPLDRLKDAAYKNTGLSTEGVEHMTAGEQKEFFDAEWRTTKEHTRRGFTTIAITGDKGFKGVAYETLKSGETVIDVYHDKPNLAKGAQRVMAKADTEGGIDQMIKDFEEFASGKRKLNSAEMRDQLYDIIAAVDFSNANKTEPWSERLYLAACKAGAEQTSVSGLSLRMWHKMAMSSPEHRAKVVREQILDMFNRSAGMRKMLKKGKGSKLTLAELDDVLKNNAGLKAVFDELEQITSATSKDEVEELASRALLHARKAMPMTVLDQLTQWRYVAMLSSPKTHVRNITSNIYSATLGQCRDAIASVTEENIKKGNFKAGKKFKEAVEAGKINQDEYFKSAGGMSATIFKDSHQATRQGFSLNRINSKIERAKLRLEATAATDTAGIQRLTNRIADLEEAKKAAQAEYDKAFNSIKRGEAKKALESWSSMGRKELVAAAEKWEKRQYGGAGKQLFKINDKLSSFIGNALETSDALALERIYREKFDKILTANNWSELSKLAASGDEAAQNALKRLEEYASQEAAYTAALDTYRNYNSISTALNNFVNDSLFNYDAPLYKKIAGGAVHAVFPFTKVPVNLMKRGFHYSPVGLIQGKRALIEAIEAGDITAINRACERLAEGRIGTGILMVGAALGFADPDGDLITGRLSNTDFIDRKKKDAGYQNYSITLGDKNFTLDWATPTAQSTFTGVDFGRTIRNAIETVASDNGMQFNFWDAVEIPLVLVSRMVEPTLQLGVFQGINETLESVVKSDNYDDSGTNINPALKIVTSIAGNYINSQLSPAILGSLSRSLAPYDYFITGETDSEYAFNQQLAKHPLLSRGRFGAKTNVWGEIKNEKKDAGDYVKSFAKNMLSPSNINTVTWDENDEWAEQFYKETGFEGAFPKNKYDKNIEVGRIKGEHSLTLTNKEVAEYNVQRGRSGADAIADALDTVVFNRWDKDSKGKRTIPHADNITDEKREKLIKQFEGKGIREVVDYIRKTPQFQSATVAEQKQVLNAIYGAGGDSDSESKGAKRSAERLIATKKGITETEYDYYNETPKKVQENLKPYIDSGQISVEMALDFTRNAGKTYYTTDESGEKGGTVTTRYNKKEMMEYLASKGYSYEEAEILYNAYKSANAKDFNGIDTSSGSGYRRGYGGYRRRSGSRSVKIPALKQSSYKASKQTYKDIASSLKTRSSGSKVSLDSPIAKVEPPKVKFKKYEV